MAAGVWNDTNLYAISSISSLIFKCLMPCNPLSIAHFGFFLQIGRRGVVATVVTKLVLDQLSLAKRGVNRNAQIFKIIRIGINCSVQRSTFSRIVEDGFRGFRAEVLLLLRGCFLELACLQVFAWSPSFHFPSFPFSSFPFPSFPFPSSPFPSFLFLPHYFQRSLCHATPILMTYFAELILR